MTAKRWLFALAAATGLSSAQAQGILDEGIGALEAVCKGAPTVGWDGLQFVCSSLDTLKNTKAKLDNATSDLAGLWDRALRRAIGAALDRVGADLPMSQVNTWVQDLDTALGNGYTAFLGKMDQISDSLRDEAIRRAFAPASDPESPAGVAQRAYRLNPNLAAKVALTASAQAKATGDTVLANANTERANAMAETLSKSVGEQQTKNLDTLATVTKTGVADKTRDRGINAVSTRAAVQALVEAQADSMMQQASTTNQVLGALQDVALQQALTTRQLGVLAEQIIADRQERLKAWQANFEQEIGAVYRQAQAQGQALQDVGSLFGRMGE